MIQMVHFILIYPVHLKVIWAVHLKCCNHNILNNAKRPLNFEEMKEFYTVDLPRLVSYYEGIIIEDVQYNCEAYEFEGSVYLAAPNTEWRGPELIDRVDY